MTSLAAAAATSSASLRAAAHDLGLPTPGILELGELGLREILAARIFRVELLAIRAHDLGSRLRKLTAGALVKPLGLAILFVSRRREDIARELFDPDVK